MKMNKKGDVNWVIISMVIGMIALFVIIYIFYSQAKGAQTGIQGLSSCQSRGGTCVDKTVRDIQANAGADCLFHYGGCVPKAKETNGLEYCCIPPETTTTK
jgi:hypothetical protein